MPNPAPLSAKAEAFALRDSGLKQREIAQRVGVSQKTVCVWFQRADGVQVVPHEDLVAKLQVACLLAVAELERQITNEDLPAADRRTAAGILLTNTARIMAAQAPGPSQAQSIVLNMPSGV